MARAATPTAVRDGLEPYVAAFDRVRAAGGPPWLVDLRERAMTRFRALGFPTTRDEEWRFTSVRPIVEQHFVLPDNGGVADGLGLAPFRAAETAAAELVFVNGRHVPELSRIGALPAGVRIESIRSAVMDDGSGVEEWLGRVAPFEQLPFVALNTALVENGAFIRVPAHTVLEAPIHLLFVAADEQDEPPTMSYPRVLVVMEDDSQAAIVERYAGPHAGRYFTDAVTEIVLGESAVLDHYEIQQESTASHHIGAIHVRAGRAANFSSHSISLGGALVRNDVVAVLDGEGAYCTLNGLYLADGARLVDNHTTIDHALPHCGSRETYNGILADRARGVFNGKIVVRPDAQKTDARQTNRALLLSEDAQINTKPQLEIFANDVKCTHGAAIGQLDDQAVFYLRTRGLNLAEARRLLIQAFAGDVLAQLPMPSVRVAVEDVLRWELTRLLAAVDGGTDRGR